MSRLPGIDRKHVRGESERRFEWLRSVALNNGCDENSGNTEESDEPKEIPGECLFKLHTDSYPGRGLASAMCRGPQESYQSMAPIDQYLIGDRDTDRCVHDALRHVVGWNASRGNVGHNDEHSHDGCSRTCGLEPRKP